MEAQAAARAHARSLYRSLLRELPSPTASTSSFSSHKISNTANNSSPLRSSIRDQFVNYSSANASPEYQLARRQEIEQMVQYLKAQRMYGTLLERYNPGANMSEEERVRLSARRVGMNMPVEWYGTVEGKAGEFGVKYQEGSGVGKLKVSENGGGDKGEGGKKD